jgi:hypothetical protein
MKLINSLNLEHRQPVTQAFQVLKDLNDHLTTQPLDHDSSILERPLEMDSLVYPVTRQFLHLPSPVDESDSGLAVLSCLRAGALVYMAELRSRSGVHPVRTTFQIIRLRNSIEAIVNYPALDPVMHLWFLTVGALESAASTDHDYFCFHLKRLRTELKLETITQFQEHLGQVMWLDTLFELRLSSLLPRI